MGHAQKPVEMSPQPDPHSEEEEVTPDSIGLNMAEENGGEQANKMTAAAMSTGTSTDTATETKLNGDAEKQQAEQEDEAENEGHYPRGSTLAVLTIGLMAVVLVVAMDNYIIGAFENSSLLCIGQVGKVLTEC